MVEVEPTGYHILLDNNMYVSNDNSQINMEWKVHEFQNSDRNICVNQVTLYPHPCHKPIMISPLKTGPDYRNFMSVGGFLVNMTSNVLMKQESRAISRWSYLSSSPISAPSPRERRQTLMQLEHWVCGEQLLLRA